jgi:hypothetical protein
MTQTSRLRILELERLAAFHSVLYLPLLFSLVLHNSSEGLKDLIRKDNNMDNNILQLPQATEKFLLVKLTQTDR